jgi:uncharacterized protein YqiB (DUF1249 family)
MNGWWIAAGGVVVGLVVGLAVGEGTRLHQRRVLDTYRRDLAEEKRQRRLAAIEADRQAAEASRLRSTPPSIGDWVPRAEMVRLAHRAEVAEAVAEQAEERLEELRQHPSGGAS